tara:strand:- start:1452 stop:2300 length:849 start_codon:yes stop_codon:yes gene_type:complete
MKRKVILEGEIGDKFGKEFTIDAASFKDVILCLRGNFPDFQKYLVDAVEKDIGFSCEVGGKPLSDEKELFLRYPEGAMVISAVPAGSKSGGSKIFAALALAALFIIMPAGALYTAAVPATATTAATAGSLTFAGTMVAGLALNLAMVGFQQIMAPDPSVDSGPQEESYLFKGTGQIAIEGDPVPVLYGRLRVPARPISMEIRNSSQAFTNVSATSPAAVTEDQVAASASAAEANATAAGLTAAQVAAAAASATDNARTAPVQPSINMGQYLKYSVNLANLVY